MTARPPDRTKWVVALVAVLAALWLSTPQAVAEEHEPPPEPEPAPSEVIVVEIGDDLALALAWTGSLMVLLLAGILAAVVVRP